MQHLKPSAFSRLSKLLGHQFHHAEHLLTALTHRSAGTPNNERLEFLGDAILSYVIANALFERFPSASEGELTRIRASLVKKDTLAELAQTLDLGPELRLGGGELKSGGWRRASILADALEAVFGAVYLDAGLPACQVVILHLFAEKLHSVSPELGKDAKTRLQEYLQGHKQNLPVYRVLTVEGDAHQQHFAVLCEVPGLEQPTQGEGNSRRHAEQAAAACALDSLQRNPKKIAVKLS